jgi:hypothetical protein
MITLPTRACQWAGDLVRDKIFSLGLGVNPGECAGAPHTGHRRPRGDATIGEAVYHLHCDLFKVAM